MMSAEHRAILNTNRLTLVRSLQISEAFLSFLRHDYTLTDEMQQEIMSRSTNGERVGRLLDILVKRGPTAFGQLIQALIITDQDYIAKMLDLEVALDYIKNRDDERRRQTPVFTPSMLPATVSSQSAINSSMQPPYGDMQNLTSLQLQLLIQQQQMMPQTQIVQQLFLQQLQQQFQSSGANQQQFQPPLSPSIGQDIQQRNLNPVPLARHQVSQDGPYASMSSSGQPVHQEESTSDINVRGRVENAPVQCTEDREITDSAVLDSNIRLVHDVNQIVTEIKKIDEHPTMNLQVRPVINLADLDDLVHTNEIYPVRSNIRGRAMIISNSQFKEFRVRAGSDYDEVNLRALFEKLQFQVSVHKDQTRKQIWNLLEDERMNDFHRKADMFVLFILSHGSQGSIYASDGEEVDIDKMMECFDGKNCPGLQDKPKIFFIQACQGQAMTTGGRHETDGLYESDVEPQAPRDEVPDEYFSEKMNRDIIQKLSKMSIADQDGYVPGFVHEKADMLVAYATVKGYRAWRRTDLGSWFVRCVVYVFSNRACSEHLTDLLTRVNNIMSHMKVEDPGKPQYKQIAEKKDTLRKKVFFFPGYNGPKRCTR